jgi:C-terminal peptidase (prc)
MRKIIITLVLFLPLFCQAQNVDKSELLATDYKMSYTLNLIRNFYTQKTDVPKIVEKGIVNMLKELDPHSVYISKDEVQKMNEPLVGNFDGVGISFQLLADTIHVVDVISGGPSEKVGILAGDKILKVDNYVAIGDSIKNDWVFKHLRGVKGTKVQITVLRLGRIEPLIFNVTRDKIPLTSVDTWFMLDKTIGYIRLDRFAQESGDEVVKAIKDLKSQGMKSLIFDLRGNGGGYLDIAFKICDEFLSDDKLIVYTEGVSSPRQDLDAHIKGNFENGKLILLIDENSASASEIVSGAIQDWDRGVIVGRRSFGKGLVQRPFNLPDGSQIRLTTSHYYTPSGRCIQKPYNDGVEDYFKDYMKRYQHKEFITPDSIHFPDSLKYFTANKRVVYGGGGIMPDVFVPMDTSRASDYLINLRSKGLFNTFALNWAEEHRAEFLKQNPTYEDFCKAYDKLNLMEDFTAYATKEGVSAKDIKKEWVNGWFLDYLQKQSKDTTKTAYTSYEDYTQALLSSAQLQQELKDKAKIEDARLGEINDKSNIYIAATLKAIIARNLYGTRYYYQTIQDTDDVLQQAIKVLKNDKMYNSLLKPKK